MTPSELLVAAADRIRDLAVAAQPGPWRSFPSPDMPGETVVHAVTDTTGEPHPHRALTAHGLLCAEADAAWVAALSPAVAPALEAWLRSTAKAVFVWEELDRPFTAAEEDAVRFAAAVCPELVGEDHK